MNRSRSGTSWRATGARRSNLRRSRLRSSFHRHDNDRGAILVLALVFLTVGTIVIGALTFSLSNDLNNSANFKTSRAMEYSLSNATNQAIQSIRYTPLLSVAQTLNASPPSYCWGNGPTSSISAIAGQPSIAAWCSTQWFPTSTTTRIVTISACPAAETALQCGTNPNLQAVVVFDDYPNGTNLPTNTKCVTYCGSSVAISSWTRSPDLPTLNSLVPASGVTAGGLNFTISGSGFTTGTTVNFVEEKNGVPTTDNVILAATNVVVVDGSTITAVSPAIVAGLTYFVTVNTPAGASLFSPSGIFTYQWTLPTASSITPVSGGSVGGVLVNVIGTGFVNGSLVQFIKSSNGVAVSPKVVYSATNVTVISPTLIQALTPAVADVSQFLVSVITPAGTTGSSSAITYSTVAGLPLVSSVSPTHGPTGAGTVVTVFGNGFITGATVNFCQSFGSGCFATPLQSGSPITASTITVVVPSHSNGTYMVFVTQNGVTNPTGPIYTSP